MGFSRQEYWSGLPCPPPGDPPHPRIEPVSLTSPALKGVLFTTSATWKSWAVELLIIILMLICIKVLLERTKTIYRRWWSRRVCAYLLLWEQNRNSLLNNPNRMLDPTKKDNPYPRAKEKPKKDGRRGKILFRIKSHYCQRCSEGSNKTLCSNNTQRPHRDWARSTFQCLSVSWGGTGQRWPAVRKGALAEVDLGDAVCGKSPFGGGRH